MRPRALAHGDGKWLYQLIGRDAVNPYNISSLIKLLETLENKNVGFVIDTLTLKSGVKM